MIANHLKLSFRKYINVNIKSSINYKFLTSYSIDNTLPKVIEDFSWLLIKEPDPINDNTVELITKTWFSDLARFDLLTLVTELTNFQYYRIEIKNIVEKFILAFIELYNNNSNYAEKLISQIATEDISLNVFKNSIYKYISDASQVTIGHDLIIENDLYSNLNLLLIRNSQSNDFNCLSLFTHFGDFQKNTTANPNYYLSNPKIVNSNILFLNFCNSIETVSQFKKLPNVELIVSYNISTNNFESAFFSKVFCNFLQHSKDLELVSFLSLMFFDMFTDTKVTDVNIHIKVGNSFSDMNIFTWFNYHDYFYCSL